MEAKRTVQRRGSTSLLLLVYLTLAIFGIPAFAGAVKPDDPGSQGQGQGNGQGQGGPHASPTPTATHSPTPTATPAPDDQPQPTAPPGPEAAPTPPDRGPDGGPGGGNDPSEPADDHTGGTHPPGNNGTVKIDGEPWDDHPDNEPHVGCVFQLDLYGYDEGAGLAAEYLFELWPPTGSGDLVDGSVFIGEDPAGGGTDHDASVTIDIEDELRASGVDPHPVQGWHVRLTVHADGSIGADVKHKMFWVTCGGETPPPTTSSPPPTTSSPPPTTSSPPPAPTTITPPTDSPTVAPTTVRPPTAPPGNLPFTGSPLGTLMAIAAALLVAGTAALRLSARSELIGRHRRG